MSEQSKFLDTTFITITKEGLPDDLINVWNDLHVHTQLLEVSRQIDGPDWELSTNYRCAMDGLNKPRQAYEDYTALKFPPEFRERISTLLNLDSLHSFNDLVREFNVLAADTLVTAEIAQDFVKRATLIIYG
jgi:hypothetical protein